MAEGARHPDPIGTDQVLVVVIGRVSVIAHRVPASPRRFVEIGVGEQTQAQCAARLTVEGADRHRFAAGADLTPGYLAGSANGSRRTTWVALIEPQPEPRPRRALGLGEARLVVQPKP
jgi:hypothetical protein